MAPLRSPPRFCFISILFFPLFDGVCMTIITQEIEIINKLGLHARAAATLVKVTSTFESEIKLTKGMFTVDGKSILGIMSLAAAQGTTLTFSCEGSDSEAAMAAITACISGYFGEGE